MQTESLINVGLAKSDLRRFWPLWLIYAIALGLFILAPLYSIMLAQGSTAGPDGYDSYFIENIWFLARFGCMPFSVIVPIVVAVCLNGRLFKPVTATFYGALPLKRRTVFASSFVAGFVPLIGVPALAAFAMLPLHASFPTQITLVMVLQWFAILVASSFVMYAIALLACQFAGTWPVAVLLYAVLGYLAVCLEGAVRIVVSSLVYGAADWDFMFDWASAPYFLAVNGLAEGDAISSMSVNWTCFLVYCVVAVLLIAVACILDARRPMESAGESVAFPQLKPVLKYLAGISVALLFAGAACLYRWLSGSGEPGIPNGIGYALILFACLAVGGFLGLVFAEIVMRRTTRGAFARSWKGAIVLALAAAVFIGGVSTDALGLVNKVPDASKVVSAQLRYDGDEAVNFSDAEGIEAIRALNEQVIAYGGVREGGEQSSSSFSFVYELADGRVHQRSYDVYFATDDNGKPDHETEGVQLIDDVLSLANSAEGKKSRFAALLDTSKENAYVYTVEYKFDEYGSTTFDIPDARKTNFIEEGLAPDLLGGEAGDAYAPWGWESSEAALDVLLQVTDADGGYVRGFWLDAENMSHTVAWLKANYPDIDEQTWQPTSQKEEG